MMFRKKKTGLFEGFSSNKEKPTKPIKTPKTKIRKYDIRNAQDRDVKLDSDHSKKEEWVFRETRKGSHDVVVLCRVKKKVVEVKRITSLEKYDKNLKSRRKKEEALEDVKNGRLLPIPIKELDSDHWSAVNLGLKYVPRDKLRERQFCKKKKFPKPYRKLITRKENKKHFKLFKRKK